MSKENADLIRRWFEEVWNKGRAGAIDEMLADDCITHGLGSQGGELCGPAGFKPFFENFRAAFSDIYITVVDTIGQGDMIAARWIAKLRHTGDQLGFPASGRTAEVTGMSFARVEGGLFKENWNNWDLMGLMQQIGVVPTENSLAHSGN